MRTVVRKRVIPRDENIQRGQMRYLVPSFSRLLMFLIVNEFKHMTKIVPPLNSDWLCLSHETRRKAP